MSPTDAASPEESLRLPAVAIFLSAFLLFQVQPLVGKLVLPWFGGSAGVWTTCLLFFQLLLLLGYLYAHLLVHRLGHRGQLLLHGGLLLAACLLLAFLAGRDLRLPAAFHAADGGRPGLLGGLRVVAVRLAGQ